MSWPEIRDFYARDKIIHSYNDRIFVSKAAFKLEFEIFLEINKHFTYSYRVRERYFSSVIRQFNVDLKRLFFSSSFRILFSNKLISPPHVFVTDDKKFVCEANPDGKLVCFLMGKRKNDSLNI